MTALDNPDQRRIALLEAAREHCARQYDDFFRTFASLDSKAQSVATLAGVQLAALLVFLREGNLAVLRAGFGDVAAIVLAVTLVVLLLVIAAAVAAMKVTSLPTPYQAAEEAEAVASLIALQGDELSDQVVVNHLSEHNEAWTSALVGIELATRRKARIVEACQWTLLVGLVGSASVLYLLVLAAWP
ncbi:MAG: hypothetical protein U0X73_04255 [Thermoanaerobaculia bacterium]